MEGQSDSLRGIRAMHNCGDCGAEIQSTLHKPEGWAKKTPKGEPQQLCSCLTLQPFVDSAGI